MGTTEPEKRAAARAALEEVTSGMRMGLGTGSTVRHFLEGLARAIEEGSIRDVAGVPTSRDTEDRCKALGIPLLELEEGTELDLAVDGADEISPRLDLVKGLGGALLREKIVAQAARRFVIIADAGKLVSGLGEKTPIPVEVAPFGWRAHFPYFRAMGARPEPRSGDGDAAASLPATSDNGNYLIDLHFPSGVPDPAEMEERLQRRSGVVESGFFLGMAQRAYVAEPGGGVRTIDFDRPGGRGE